MNRLMNRLEKFINRLNFKRAFRVHIISSFLILILCVSAIAYVSRDKIYMALDYKRASDIFKKEGISDTLKLQLNKLTSDSGDIINIIVLEKSNNIVFKANNNLYGSATNIKFTPYGLNQHYLQDNINKDIIYKVVSDENIILSRHYFTNNKKVNEDIDTELFYERDLSSKNIYLLNYLIQRDTDSKIFIMRTVSPIPYAERLLKITVVLFGLMFIIYWIGLALWVYKDSNEKQNNPSLWGLLVLLTNLAGLIIYIMYKQNCSVCHECKALQNKENIYCVKCGANLNRVCSNCGQIINRENNYCSKCGTKFFNNKD